LFATFAVPLSLSLFIVLGRTWRNRCAGLILESLAFVLNLALLERFRGRRADRGTCFIFKSLTFALLALALLHGFGRRCTDGGTLFGLKSLPLAFFAVPLSVRRSHSRRRIFRRNRSSGLILKSLAFLFPLALFRRRNPR